MNVERFGWWHIPEAVRIEQELFATSAWGEAQFWGELAGDDRAFFSALDSGVLVGYAGVTLGSEAQVMTIAVRADHQGMGIGRTLLHTLLDVADAAGSLCVQLEVETGNAGAIALYERNGFVRTGVRPNYYAQGVDALLMERHG